eukprot:Gb_20300 [translate_table: standard]
MAAFSQDQAFLESIVQNCGTINSSTTSEFQKHREQYDVSHHHHHHHLPHIADIVRPEIHGLDFDSCAVSTQRQPNLRSVSSNVLPVSMSTASIHALPMLGGNSLSILGRSFPEPKVAALGLQERNLMVKKEADWLHEQCSNLSALIHSPSANALADDPPSIHPAVHSQSPITEKIIRHNCNPRQEDCPPGHGAIDGKQCNGISQPHQAHYAANNFKESSPISEIDDTARAGNPKKRKCNRGTNATNVLETNVAHSGPVVEPLKELEETAAKSKRFRGSNSSKDHQKENSKPKSDQKTIVAASLPKEKLNAEPPKDYIHVRARRGQATDSHSLAERARREKISERMKVLQDLVPGCSKVTGKAVMLDEIINYVQSLQSQVEFLSMKLAVVNRDIGIEIDNFLPREQLHPLPLQGSDDPMLFCTNGGNYNAPPQLPAEHQALLLDVALPASNGAYPLIDRTCSTLPDGIAVGLSQVSSSWDMELQKFEEF